jgi:hypothetical protein
MHACYQSSPNAHFPLTARTYKICTPAVAEMDVLIGPPFNVRCTSRDLQVVEDIAVEWRRLVVPSAEYPAVALPVPRIRWADITLDSCSEPSLSRRRADNYRPSSVTNARSSSPFAFPVAAYTDTWCPRRRHRSLVISQPFARRFSNPERNRKASFYHMLSRLAILFSVYVRLLSRPVP